MKRIKTVNGYTIYQAATQRDTDNYNCEVGHYNIYLASDIRDYGLTNSYPEWENEDSLAVVIARCNGSSYAVACELAEELSGSTTQDMDLVRQIETRLEAGESLQEVAEDLSRQLDVVFPDGYQWELHVDEAAKDKLYFFDPEDWYAAYPKCDPYCLTWDELQEVACNAVDEFGLTWFECRAHEATQDELEQFGTSEAHRDDAALADGPEGDLEDVLDAALSEDHSCQMTCREWMQKHHPDLCGKDYFGGCCGCPEDYIPGGTCRGSDACEHLWCGDCWDQPLPEATQAEEQQVVEDQPLAEPEQPVKRAPGHATYYVTVDYDGVYRTRTVDFPAGDEKLPINQEQRIFFRTVAKAIAFDDCYGERVDEIVFDGQPCEYVGWQRGMEIAFRNTLTGEIVFDECFPEWDH